MGGTPVVARRPFRALAGGRPFRALSPAQACGIGCRQEALAPKVRRRGGDVMVEPASVSGFGDLEAVGDAVAPGFVPSAVAAGGTVALTVAGRFAAPVGHPVHRFAPVIAGGVVALGTGLGFRSYTAALVALMVGGGIWVVERLLEFQAENMLPPAAPGR